MSNVSMPHPLLPILQHQPPVLLPGLDAERLAEPDHDEEDCRAGHADEGRGDEAVLVAEVFDPGGDPTDKPSATNTHTI